MTVGFFVYLFWIIAAALLFVLVDNVGTLIIMVASVIVPALLIIMTAITAKRLEVSVSTDNTRKNGSFSGTVDITNKSIFPATSIKLKLNVKNYLNGRSHIIEDEFSVSSRSTNKIPFDSGTQYAGKIGICTEFITLTAPANLFKFRVADKGDSISEHIVMPETTPCRVFVEDTPDSLADSDVYSMVKSGNDPSETFLIREYAPGDPIKTIHWKLSQKADNIMVRELGLPIKNDILLLFDMSSTQGSGLPDCEDINTLVKVFFSVSLALSEQEINYTLGFCNNHTGAFSYHDISAPADRDNLTESLLSNTFTETEIPFVELFRQNLPGSHYQHIIIATLNKANNLSSLFSGNRVNALVLNNEFGGTTQEDNVNIISFAEYDYKEIIETIEI